MVSSAAFSDQVQADTTAVMAVVTSAAGALSLLQWVWRGYLLLLKKDTYRPLGSRRGLVSPNDPL